MTEAAMNGTVPLEAVYQKLLELIRPDRDAIQWLGQRYVQQLVEGARETISTLQRLHKRVDIVSGGIWQAMLPLGEELGIPSGNIHAVKIQFDRKGGYVGFDLANPLTRALGKAHICKDIIDGHGKDAVLVGDGVTDLDVQRIGIFVIGFGGVQKRQAVLEAADAYVSDSALTSVLDILLTDEERRLIN